MQITFDTTTITDDEVRGIFALLDTVRPSVHIEKAETEDLRVQGLRIIEDAIRAAEEKLPGPVKLAEETVEDHIAEVATYDSTGLVWDERIHASSKALNADGTWRTKRGVDKALVAQVEAELRGSEETQEIVALGGAADPSQHDAEISEAAAQTVAPPAPPAPDAPLAPAVTQTTPVETAPSAPVAPSSTVSPFVALMKRVTTAQGAGKLTQPRVKELLESLDKKSIMDLRTDEDALASFAVLLDGEGV